MQLSNLQKSVWRPSFLTMCKLMCISEHFAKELLSWVVTCFRENGNRNRSSFYCACLDGNAAALRYRNGLLFEHERIPYSAAYLYVHTRPHCPSASIFVKQEQHTRRRRVSETSAYLLLVCWSTLLTLSDAEHLTLYRMVMPIGTPFLKEKINN